MKPIQIVLDLLVLLALTVTVLKYKQRRIKPLEALLWTYIWLTAVVLITLPDTAAVLARALGIGRGVDVVMYVSIMLGFYLVFRLYEKIDRLEHELTAIVRHLALSDKSSP